LGPGGRWGLDILAHNPRAGKKTEVLGVCEKPGERVCQQHEATRLHRNKKLLGGRASDIEGEKNTGGKRQGGGPSGDKKIRRLYQEEQEEIAPSAEMA